MLETINTNGNHAETILPEAKNLRQIVKEIVEDTQVIDIHTHLFAPQFGQMNLFGIDEILTYHYLIAELFRFTDIKPEVFWQLTKQEKADLVWKHIFIENTPLSEAATGVITLLNELGLEANTKNLNDLREYFNSLNLSEHINTVLKKSKVSRIVMTNDPFDAEEVAVWESGQAIDARFSAALRMDRLLNDWENISAKQYWEKSLDGRTIADVRNFIENWIAKMNPLYMAVSLPDTFDYFADDARNKLIREVVLPIAYDYNLTFAPMIGVRRGVNPALKSAGDGVGRSNITSLEKLCVENPDVRFLVTYLSRENQHELCVSARKFSNLMPFGCWWFLNNPSIISEITRERLELLGTSFIPQHSDARVLEHLIYKWKHSRKIIAEALSERYESLINAGRNVSKTDIERDVKKLFSGNFENFVSINKRQDAKTQSLS